MKALIYFLLKKKGRNNKGKITVRHKGGGLKRLYRIINFSYNQVGITKKILASHYNPNNFSKTLLVKNTDNVFEYIIPSNIFEINSTFSIGPTLNNSIGFSKPLWNIPLGSEVHNVELKPRKGAQIARSSGSFCYIVAAHKSFIILKLPSKELRLVNKICFATIGRVLNAFINLKKLKKAGQNRWRGVRPTTRGVAMNPIDHPHGGGEGKCPVGRKSPLSPWGKPTHGLKTRKVPNKFILSKKKN